MKNLCVFFSLYKMLYNEGEDGLCRIMLENKIIQLDKVKKFVQQYKILRISLSAEGCSVGRNRW